MKIKQYINERPKLKKALKITAVIGAIFSIGLNVLIFGALAVSCSNNVIYNVVEKQSNNTKSLGHITNSSDNELYSYAQGDLATSEALLGILDYFVQLDSNFDKYGTGASVEHTLTIKTYLVLTQSTFSTYVTNNRLYSTAFNSVGNSSDYGDHIKIKWQYVSYMQAWNVSFIIYFGTSTYISYGYDYARGVVNTPYISMSNTNYVVTTNGSDNPIYYFAKYDTRSADFYKQGFDAGYNEGYVAGNNDGSGNFNAFNLISNAFTSIASILNIQILPGVTLAVLIFTPLIVVLVVVVVRMFKG